MATVTRETDGEDATIDANAFNAETERQLWFYSIPLSGRGLGPSVAVANKAVIYGSGAKVVAVNAATGIELWSSPVTGSTTPAVVKGVVYIGARDNKLYALDVKTGSVRWSVDGVSAISSPAVANGKVYANSRAAGPGGTGSVDAFDAKTGAKLWSFAMAQRTNAASPSVANGVVYTGSFDDNVYALDAETGVKLWRYVTEGIMEGAPAIVNGVLYMTSSDYRLYAFSLDGTATPDPLPPGCQSNGFLYGELFGNQPDQLFLGAPIVAGSCRFNYFSGATYSGEGNFKITCSAGGQDDPPNAVFTTPGYGTPLTGCSGIVTVITGLSHNGVVVAGIVPEEPGPCDAACLARVRQRVRITP